MKKLGIVAGRGTLPLMLIKACQEQKRPFYVLALKDHAEPDLYTFGTLTAQRAPCHQLGVGLGQNGFDARLLAQHIAL